jgi:hypothetical protein
MLHVANDSDDLNPGTGLPQRKPLSKRVFIEKETSRHRVVDDGDFRRVFIIAFGKISSSENWNAGGAKEFRGNYANIERRRLST